MAGSRSACCCCCCCTSDGPSVKPNEEKTTATLGRQLRVRYCNFPTLIPCTVSSGSGCQHLSLYVYVFNGLAMNFAAGDQLWQLGAQTKQTDASIWSVCSRCKQRLMPKRSASLRVKIFQCLEELLTESVNLNKWVMKNVRLGWCSVSLAVQSSPELMMLHAVRIFVTASHQTQQLVCLGT